MRGLRCRRGVLRASLLVLGLGLCGKEGMRKAAMVVYVGLMNGCWRREAHRALMMRQSNVFVCRLDAIARRISGGAIVCWRSDGC